MRFLEILNAIRNTFIRKAAKTEPEGNPEVSDALDEPETITDVVEDKERNDLERKIHRYRAIAYHHKKKRIRKKYLKRLLDISPVDRFIYAVKQGRIGPCLTWNNGRVVWKEGFAPGSIGSRRLDHKDSKLKGDVR